MITNELYTYFVACSCYIGIFSITCQLSFTSPTQKELLDRNILSDYTLPIFASIGLAARMIATLILPMLLQFNISINSIIVTHCLVGWAGWMLILSASSVIPMILGMALVGYYTGVAFLFINTYIPEIALDNQRRVFCGVFGFISRIGMFLSFFMGIWISFRWLAVFGIVQICVFCIFLLFIPISPVQHVAQGLDEKARDTLFHLHNRNVKLEEEIRKIKSSIITKKVSMRENLEGLVDRKVLKPLFILLAMGVIKEAAGHMVMVSFSTKILESQYAMNPKAASLFYPTFLIIGAILCLMILDKCRLKWLTIAGSSIQVISHLSMSIYFLTIENYPHLLTRDSDLHYAVSIWPACNIALFAFGFGLGWGVVYFSLVGLLATTHRELYTGLSDAVSNLAACINIQIFYYLFVYLGGFTTFLIYGILQFSGLVFVYFAINI